MRELKFRAWDKESKWMIEQENLNYSILENREEHRFELMQYTGLKDKNGKEIYEGDIVKFNHWVYDDAKRKRNLSYGEIMWDGDGWIIESRRYTGSLWKIKNTEVIEVIGNIYENPELIKDGN